tara:strand:+ start:489 stop:1019 length:531 start_codon:yes stop_codon:yes gene_type:complete
MQGTRASLRYAKALFHTAKQNSIVKNVLTDIEQIEDIINQKSEFFNLIHNPTISHKKKKDLFVQIFQNKIHDTTMQFLYLVLNKGRESMLLQIISNYKDLHFEEQEIILAEIVTASPISEEMRQIIKNKINPKKQVQLVEKIDRSILGGVIINSGDLQYDASVRNKLNNIKRAFKL